MDKLSFKRISESFLNQHINEFLIIEKQHNLQPIWEESNYLLPLDLKYEYSVQVSSGSELIGYIISSQKELSVHIHRFMVNKGFTHNGIGTQLLKFYLDNIYSSSDNITLKVHQENVTAINFYLKNGFKKVDLNNTHYILELDRNYIH